MKQYLFIILVFFVLCSCKKEEKKHTIIYKVIVTNGNPIYSVSYSSSNNTTKNQSAITSNWTSASIEDKKDGASVFLTLQGGNGGSYRMNIYIDGSLEKEDRMDDPYGPKTLEAAVPD